MKMIKFYKTLELRASRYIEYEYYGVVFSYTKKLLYWYEWSYLKMQMYRLSLVGSFLGFPISILIALFFNIWLGLFVFCLSIVCEVNADIEPEDLVDYMLSSSFAYIRRSFKKRRKTYGKVH